MRRMHHKNYPFKKTPEMKKLLSFVSAFVFVLAACDKQAGQTTDVPGAPPVQLVPHWLELPETSSFDGLDFFSHNAIRDGQSLRNWSFYWDYGNRLSAWVAYPLYKSIFTGASRSEAWGFDPLLPGSKQQNAVGEYKNTNDDIWYSRGQLLPSSDRAGQELNRTTFYCTNTVPRDHDLDVKIQEILESRIRSWANTSDTCYVVSGCTTKGARYYVTDRSGNKVTVPTAFFKAVLRYSRNTTVGTDGYCAIAFFVEHDPKQSYEYLNNVRNNCISVKSLEDKLGYQLFVNLEEVLGQEKATAVKAENPKDNSWWW